MSRDYRTQADALDALQSEVAVWSQKNFPNSKPYHPLLGLTEEVGELAHAHLKAEQGIRGTPEEHQAAKLDAVGDIAIYLADYCERNGISLGHAVSITWHKVRQRNWHANKVDGTASTEFKPAVQCATCGGLGYVRKLYTDNQFTPCPTCQSVGDTVPQL